MRVPLVSVCRLLPVGGCGATSSRWWREEVTPGEHQIQGREGIRRMPGGTLLLLDLRDVPRLTGRRGHCRQKTLVLVPMKNIHIQRVAA
uniref:Secreted protein n=1 Tax=Aegilops tauschii subsp. strangulata TaxID=200361 RepID=A0A453GMP7_AEGTS